MTALYQIANDGLSPLARGTLCNGAVRQGCSRFIPAGAGNTMQWSSATRLQPVYPRWRGEHDCFESVTGSNVGLSPLARGTLRDSGPGISPMRFIPAGAGNTYSCACVLVESPVYPRWRGEHTTRYSGRSATTGLSPLARGTHCAIFVVLFIGRFIPAGAGNTSDALTWCVAIPVYPRWRGEHNLTLISNNIAGGLSPLARGTQRNIEQLVAAERFIPAGAGNTSVHRTISSYEAVYPRWRGEHKNTVGYISQRFGLSPLARGTLQHLPTVRR